MKNPLFNLINAKFEIFKTSYNIAYKEAKSGKNYFLIVPKIKHNGIFIIAFEAYTLEDYHISVYENLKLDTQYSKTHYHLTFSLKKENTQQVTAHIYFDSFNKIIWTSFKDEANNRISTDNVVEIIQYAKLLASDFANLFSEIYTNEHESFIKNHDKLLDTLTEKSKALSDSFKKEKKDNWLLYKECLDKLLQNIEVWRQFDLYPQKQLFTYFYQLKEQVDRKLLGNTSNISLEIPLKIEGLMNEVNIDSHKHSTETSSIISISPQQEQIDSIDKQLKMLEANTDLSEPLKIEQEYNLLNKKFELIKEDKQALDNMCRIRQLEKHANRLLITLLYNNSTYEATSQNELESLIKIIPQAHHSYLCLCIENDRLQALKLLLQYHQYLNLDLLIPNKGISLLELAYQKRNIKIFEFLLEAGASCDLQRNDGNTLLMSACQDSSRADEMVLLLKAGASNILRNSGGYTAFGCMTMVKSCKPDLSLIELFIKNCKSFLIDFMQGLDDMRCPPLAFACQENWIDVVKLYLKYNADPTCIKETDLLHSLVISAVKGHVDLCRIILSESKSPIEEGVIEALHAAKQYKQTEVEKILIEYMNIHKISSSSPYKQKLGIGASISSLQRIMEGDRLSLVEILSKFSLFKTNRPTNLKQSELDLNSTRISINIVRTYTEPTQQNVTLSL